jgi:putative spermidine/putrescine transport system permease protein
MRAYRSAYPLRWRVMDGFEAVAAALWPRSLSRAVPYLLLAPAILVTGLLAIGLFEMADGSLHVLDTATFLPSETYTLAN